MQQSDGRYVSKQARLLYDALCERGITAKLDYSDGHKTVDIAILTPRIYIEVDGIQHFTDPAQIQRDFKRYHFSDGDDFSTFYVTNQIIDTHLRGVADALVEVVRVKSMTQSLYRPPPGQHVEQDEHSSNDQTTGQDRLWDDVSEPVE